MFWNSNAANDVELVNQCATELSTSFTERSLRNISSVEEVSQLTIKLDNLKSNYDTVLPLFKDIISKVEKLSKAKELADLIKMGPNIDFNHANTITFIRWYVYLKSQIIKMPGKYDFGSAFTYFEENDSVKFAGVDKTTLSMLTDAVWNSTKDASGKKNLQFLFDALESPPLFNTMEKIRLYHCGPRDIPLYIMRNLYLRS